MAHSALKQARDSRVGDVIRSLTGPFVHAAMPHETPPKKLIAYVIETSMSLRITPTARRPGSGAVRDDEACARGNNSRLLRSLRRWLAI